MKRENLRNQILEVLSKKIPLEDCIVILYGSIALGEETKTSDVDLLIDCLRPLDDWVFLELQEELNLFVDTPRKVNLVEMGDLSEVVPLFEKILKVVEKDCENPKGSGEN